MLNCLTTSLTIVVLLVRSVIISAKFVGEEIRIVLLGKTRSAKSSTGNTILGKNALTSLLSGSSVTHTCSKQPDIRFEQQIVVVDTPGLFGTQDTNETIQE